jgi:hypothetical protein
LVAGTQGLVDSRYRVLKTGALIILSLDVFYFFACYLSAHLAGKAVLQFTGLLQHDVFDITQILLMYTVLGFAIVSLPVAIQGKRLALAINKPKARHLPGIPTLGSIESAFAHYQHTNLAVLGFLSVMNLFASAYFIAYGQFWLLVLISCVGFFNKLVVFPGQRSFNRWMWRVLDIARDSAVT